MTIRKLNAEECIKMTEIDASQYIHKAWREVDGKRRIITIDYFDPTWPNGYELHYENALLNAKEGLVLGAFKGDQLVGILCIRPMDKWNEYRYALLDQLFISKAFRGQGIGKLMLEHAMQMITQWSVERILICAGSAEETIAFYKAIGCTEVTQMHQGLYEDDPRDMQLEMLVPPTPLRKS